MAEFFLNKFVIKIESGHPGYRSYTIIATRQSMNQMVQALNQALAQSEQSQTPELQADMAPSKLWGEYATIAYRETSASVLCGS